MISSYLVVIISAILFSGWLAASATDPILITISEDMTFIVFDGRWSNLGEWKRTSLDTLSYNDGMQIQLRTAHQENFIYVFIDVVSDTYLDKGSDRAAVCLDGKNDKAVMANVDDYCFIVTLDTRNPVVLQGGSPLGFHSNFKKITVPDGFIGIGSVSDENDRYSKIPHPSYEFRIPTDLVGRSNNYGFYVWVYDGHFNKFYSWPYDSTTDSLFKVASPSSWGDLVSPDNSLPEFEWPIFLLLPSFLLVIYLTKCKRTTL